MFLFLSQFSRNRKCKCSSSLCFYSVSTFQEIENVNVDRVCVLFLSDPFLKKQIEIENVNVDRVCVLFLSQLFKK